MIEYWLKKGLFRNANHAIWFINSIFFFIFYVLIQSNKFGKWVLLFPIIFHISPVINSINKNYLKKEKSEIYSVDCIWFNTIMIVLYSILMYKFI